MASAELNDGLMTYYNFENNVNSTDEIHPQGAVHAYPNLLWPPNNKPVATILERHVIDEMSIAKYGEKPGLLEAYLKLKGNTFEIRYNLFNSTSTTGLNEDGYFNEEFNVRFQAIKEGRYDIELYATDLNDNHGLVDSTYIVVPHDMGNNSPF